MNKQTIINVMQGICRGDAFGFGLEFSDRNKIIQEITYDQFHNWRTGKHGLNVELGFYSDDAEQSFGITEALLATEMKMSSGQRFTTDLLIRKFKDEYDRDKQKKGFGRQGHGSIKDWYEGQKTIQEVRTSQRTRLDPGNAPVMRCVPIIFAPQERHYEYAVINAISTHENIRGIESAVLVVATGDYLLRREGTREGLIPYLKEYGTWIDTKALEMIDALPHPLQMSEKDYVTLLGPQPTLNKPVMNGLPCASLRTAYAVIYVLKHAKSAFEALKFSIELGGDIDSLAAVTVGIASGLYGPESLPGFLRTQSEGLERAKLLGERLYEKFFETQKTQTFELH
ncbi:ADP-ribosylglycohydrolase family protein [Patescibacteria group bacterium]|nr:ADP-ribosylglycohydrolase family protein [Patescibacteria group bacterium]